MAQDGRDVAFEAFIAKLYRSGLSVAPEGFRGWGLRQLRKVIPFDAALWGSGTMKTMRFHTVELVGIGREFADSLETTHRINPILPRIVKSLDTPVDMSDAMPDDKFFASDLYRQSFEPFGINRILSTLHSDPRSGLYSLLSLYRKDRDQPFTADERTLQKRAVYHLFQSASHAFFLHLMRTHEERPPGSGAAVIDREGRYYEAQPRFLDMVEKHFAPKDGETLPFKPPEIGKIDHVAGKLCVKTEPFGELFCVYLWSAGPLDRLTAREREIVYAVTQGLSFKQAARKIGVAPSTVANHLYRIYRKLEVNSRSELAGLVYPATSN